LTLGSYALPLVAYSFLGIEIIAVTAFEARNDTAVRWPSRTIVYVVFILYILCTIGESLNVQWQNSHLPYIYGGVGNSTTASSPTNPASANMVINAVYAQGYKGLAGFLNGCLIFSVVSASNTSLYVSSRTLYGMIREMPDTNWFYNKIRWISKVPRTGVPAVAILISAVAFYWLPFLQLKEGYALQDVRG
jgi:yeast amino acid transporter